MDIGVAKLANVLDQEQILEDHQMLELSLFAEGLKTVEVHIDVAAVQNGVFEGEQGIVREVPNVLVVLYEVLGLISNSSLLTPIILHQLGCAVTLAFVVSTSQEESCSLFRYRLFICCLQTSFWVNLLVEGSNSKRQTFDVARGA